MGWSKQPQIIIRKNFVILNGRQRVYAQNDQSHGWTRSFDHLRMTRLPRTEAYHGSFTMHRTLPDCWSSRMHIWTNKEGEGCPVHNVRDDAEEDRFPIKNVGNKEFE